MNIVLIKYTGCAFLKRGLQYKACDWLKKQISSNPLIGPTESTKEYILNSYSIKSFGEIFNQFYNYWSILNVLLY